MQHVGRQHAELSPHSKAEPEIERPASSDPNHAHTGLAQTRAMKVDVAPYEKCHRRFAGRMEAASDFDRLSLRTTATQMVDQKDELHGTARCAIQRPIPSINTIATNSTAASDIRRGDIHVATGPRRIALRTTNHARGPTSRFGRPRSTSMSRRAASARGDSARWKPARSRSPSTFRRGSGIARCPGGHAGIRTEYRCVAHSQRSAHASKKLAGAAKCNTER